MEISTKELKERQEWTLSQKIDHSLGAIEQFYAFTGNKMVVSFSGGKDSTVLLHLVRSLYPNTKGVFGNTTNEFSEILRFVKTVDNIDIVKPKVTFIKTINEYGFPLISKKVAKAINHLKNPSDKNKNVRNLHLTGYNRKGIYCPSFKLAKKWRFLVDEKFNITSKCCDILKLKPLNDYMKINKTFAITGIMADNSQQRKGNYLKYGCNIFNGSKSKSRPLSIWTDKDIWNYIKMFNVKYCDIYDKGETNTGCAYCGFGIHLEKESRFERLKNREPKRYKQMMSLENNGVTYFEAIQKTLYRTAQTKKIF